MEYNENLIKELNDIQQERNTLNTINQKLTARKNNLIEKIKKNASFNVAILFVIANLMSYKERKNYIPISFKRYNRVYWNPPTFFESICVGIADEENIKKFMESRSDNTEKFLGLQLGYELFQDNTTEVKSFQDDTDNWIMKKYNPTCYSRQTISFDFILDKFDILRDYGVNYSEYNFEDFDYVQDFIIYLFNLQYNSDKKLTFYDMQYALKNYIEILENKENEQRK